MTTGRGYDTESALQDFVGQATDGAQRMIAYRREDDKQSAKGAGNYIVRGRSRDNQQMEVFRLHVAPQIDGFTATEAEVSSDR